MKLAPYSRVSTADQHPDAQLAPLREYAQRRGAEAIEFLDHGVSGRRDRRPGLDRLREAVRRREVDGVVVVKLDRLARSIRHLCELAEELEALGVDLVVLDQAIDTTTPSGRLLFGVLAAVAAFERDLIVERTRAGLEAAKRRGRRLGRPRKVFERREPFARLEATSDEIVIRAPSYGIEYRFAAGDIASLQKISWPPCLRICRKQISLPRRLVFTTTFGFRKLRRGLETLGYRIET